MEVIWLLDRYSKLLDSSRAFIFNHTLRDLSRVLAFKREAPCSRVYVLEINPVPFQYGQDSTCKLEAGFIHLFKILFTNFCIACNGRPLLASSSKDSIAVDSDKGLKEKRKKARKEQEGKR